MVTPMSINDDAATALKRMISVMAVRNCIVVAALSMLSRVRAVESFAVPGDVHDLARYTGH
jgi:hypothetical protein